MPYLDVLGCHFEKSLSYLKLAPSKLLYCKGWCLVPRICLIAKFHKNIKMPKFGIQDALLGYFWDRIKKNCHI